MTTYNHLFLFLSQNNQNNTGSIAIYYLNLIKLQKDKTLGGPTQTGILFVKFAIML